MKVQIVIGTYPAYDAGVVKRRIKQLEEHIAVHPEKDGQYVDLVSQELNEKEAKVIQKKLDQANVKYTIRKIKEGDADGNITG